MTGFAARRPDAPVFITPPNRLPLDVQAKIETWLEDLLADEALAHAFPVMTKVHDNGRVEVYLDSDRGIDLATCQRVSRGLEAHLDETQVLGEKYTREVSSPGPKHPMTNPRQFPKHVGRTLDVTLDDGATVSGELSEVTDAGLVLTEEVVVRVDNKRTKQQRRHAVDFGAIRGAHVRFAFK